MQVATRNGLLMLGALVAAAWPPLAVRAAWEVAPELGLTTEVDDNARLLINDQPSSTRAALDARVRLRSFSERGQAYFEPRIVGDSYANARDAELENTDVFLIGGAMRKFRKSDIDFNFDYARQSVLRSAIGDALFGTSGDIPIEAEGSTFGTFTDERRRYDLGLNYERTLSERTKLRFETSLLDVSYLGNQSTTRSDYSSGTLAAVLTRLVDLRNEVSATLYVSDFQADRNDNDTGTVGVRGAFLRPLSQTWTFQLEAGVARSDYTFLDTNGLVVDNATNHFTFGFQFNQRSERTNWTIGADRSLSPSNDGFLARRDELRLQMRHALTPRLTLSTGVRFAGYARVAQSTVPRDNRKYGRLSLQVEWLITPKWALTTGVDSVTQEYATVNANATSNSIVVGVRYRGRPSAAVTASPPSIGTRRIGDAL